MAFVTLEPAYRDQQRAALRLFPGRVDGQRLAAVTDQPDGFFAATEDLSENLALVVAHGDEGRSGPKQRCEQPPLQRAQFPS